MKSHIKIWRATSNSIFCADNYFIKLARLAKGNLLPLEYRFLHLYCPGTTHKHIRLSDSDGYLTNIHHINLCDVHIEPSIIDGHGKCVNQRDTCVCVRQRMKMKCRTCKGAVASSVNNTMKHKGLLWDVHLEVFPLPAAFWIVCTPRPPPPKSIRAFTLNTHTHRFLNCRTHSRRHLLWCVFLEDFFANFQMALYHYKCMQINRILFPTCCLSPDILDTSPAKASRIMCFASSSG